MTAREKSMVAWIAKVVMGLTTDGIPGSGWYRHSAGTQVRFRPHLSISDAMDALEAWTAANGNRGWQLESPSDDDHPGKYMAYLYFGATGWTSTRDELAETICEALCAATGFQWEGKNDRAVRDA